jgi:hypothetical protein
MEGVDKNALPSLSQEKISAEYPLFASSLYNLIQNSEARMGARKQSK